MSEGLNKSWNFDVRIREGSKLGALMTRRQRKHSGNCFI